MYGPAVRCKSFRRSGGCAVLHRCIRPLIGARCAPGHHGYPRACDLMSRQASSGPSGKPVFARAGKTNPPSRFILSQTSAGKWTRLRHRALLILGSSFVRADGRSFVPACTLWIAPRAGGQSRPAVAVTSHLARGAARPRLDGSEHGARIKRAGRSHHRSSSSRNRGPWPIPPRRCGRVC
jgi:hypothetical protein